MKHKHKKKIRKFVRELISAYQQDMDGWFKANGGWTPHALEVWDKEAQSRRDVHLDELDAILDGAK